MRRADSRIAYRELGDRQLQSVRTAVRGVMLATLAMTSGIAVAQTTLPPVIVTAPYPYGYAPDTGGGGGTGTNNPNCTADCNPSDIPPPPPPAVPLSQVPPLSKIICGAQKYGAEQKRYPTNFLNVFQFVKRTPGGGGAPYAYSSTSNIPPPGYDVMYGTTIDPNPLFPSGGSTIYASGVQPSNGNLTYIPPGGTTSITQSRNYNAIENAVATAEHEFAHQNGVDNEDRAEGFGVAAADAYKADHGAKCP